MENKTETPTLEGYISDYLKKNMPNYNLIDVTVDGNKVKILFDEEMGEDELEEHIQNFKVHHVSYEVEYFLSDGDDDRSPSTTYTINFR